MVKIGITQGGASPLKLNCLRKGNFSSYIWRKEFKEVKKKSCNYLGAQLCARAHTRVYKLIYIHKGKVNNCLKSIGLGNNFKNFL